MRLATQALAGLLVLLATADVAAQVLTTQPVDGPATYVGRYDTATGQLDATPAPPGGAVVYSNTGLTGAAFIPGPGLYTMDWSLLGSAPLNQITDLQIAYVTSSAVPVSVGIRVHAGATGGGNQGAIVSNIVVSGLPGSASGGIEAFIADIDLEPGNLDFFLGDGPIGYSYEFFEGVTGAFIPNPPSDANVVDAIDQYTSAGTYLLTGSFGGNPFASLYMQMNAIEPPECFLVMGDEPGPGLFQWGDNGHVFDTQVGDHFAAYPVLMEDMPSFVLPGQANPRGQFAAPTAPTGSLDDDVGHAAATPTGDALPWEFNVQVLMWNPFVFPSLPEQYTHGLAVRVLPDGRVFSVPYGRDKGGMGIWVETFVNEQGKQAIRFPFDIPLL